MGRIPSEISSGLSYELFLVRIAGCPYSTGTISTLLKTKFQSFKVSEFQSKTSLAQSLCMRWTTLKP
jgi:hypothetical protein